MTDDDLERLEDELDEEQRPAEPPTAYDLINDLMEELTRRGFRGILLATRSPDLGMMTIARGDLTGMSSLLREAVSENLKERREIKAHGLRAPGDPETT